MTRAARLHQTASERLGFRDLTRQLRLEIVQVFPRSGEVETESNFRMRRQDEHCVTSIALIQSKSPVPVTK